MARLHFFNFTPQKLKSTLLFLTLIRVLNTVSTSPTRKANYLLPWQQTANPYRPPHTSPPFRDLTDSQQKDCLRARFLMFNTPGWVCSTCPIFIFFAAGLRTSYNLIPELSLFKPRYKHSPRGLCQATSQPFL